MDGVATGTLRNASRFALHDPSGKGAQAGTLYAVSVTADVVECGASIELEQTFVNDDPDGRPLEALYEFVLPSQAAVCEFRVEVEGGQHIHGELVPIEEAKDTYSDALASGHSSYLLSYKGGGQVFSVDVGLLPLRRQVTIWLRYISQLTINQGTLALTLPVGSASLPPSADLTLYASFVTVSRIEKISSNYPDAETAIEEDCKQAAVSFTSSASEPLVDDLVIRVKLAEDIGTNALVEVDQAGSKALMVSFSPTFSGRLVSSESGSMSGSRITHVRDTLQILLRSISEGDRFNIIGFGTSTDRLFEEPSVPYDDQSLETASQHVQGMRADLGGTEILKPLLDIFDKPPVEGSLRQIFILTDGEVSNPNQCIEAVRRQSGATRVFTFGIGQGASRTLVEGLAQAGGGQHEMVSGGVDIEDAVLRQLNRALRPTLTDLRIDWGRLSVVQQTPTYFAPLTSGARLTVYALLAAGDGEDNDSGDEGDDRRERFGRMIAEQVGLEGRTLALAGEPESANVLRFGIPSADVKVVEGQRVLLRLFAASAISDLEGPRGASESEADTQLRRARAVELSLRYRVLSKFTAFVGVEERTDAVAASMVHRRFRPVGLRSQRKVRTVMINGQEYPVVDVARSKTGKHGSAKAHITVIDPATGKKLSHIMPASQLDAAMVSPSSEAEPAAPISSGGDVPKAPQRHEEDRARIRKIIMLQSAAGVWTLDDLLASVPGLSREECLAWSGAELPVAPEVDEPVAGKRCATLLLVAYLTLAFPEWEHYWALVVRKARKSIAIGYPTELADLETKAAAFLRQQGTLSA